MAYKVLIPAAGTGSRLEEITKHINKSLVPIGGKAAISLIMESFPAQTEFVVAIGYKGDIVKEYLSLAYSDKHIDTADIDPYEGQGSGLGLSIQMCKEYLQEPFIFCSCDTIVNEEIPAPNENWMGFGRRDNLSQYRTLHLTETSEIKSIDEKGTDVTSQARPYIGLAGIHDYADFWGYMEAGGIDAINMGEAYGLRQILNNGGKITSKEFTWFDTGVKNELFVTRKRFGESGNNILKTAMAQAVWGIDNRYIFFFNEASQKEIFRKDNKDKIIDETEHMICIRNIGGM